MVYAGTEWLSLLGLCWEFKKKKQHLFWMHGEACWSFIVLTWCPLCLSSLWLSLSPSVCLWTGPQDQYQYLYKALLSLVGTKENGSGLLARNINGTMASMSDQSDQAESMESLVWEALQGPELRASCGSKHPARSLSPQRRLLTL